ncbi:MAG: hypothetical protein GY796_04585 [Chloroflexi bacterium]|nr:hypothetical protein [Chloroflexota bacterium]
MPVAVTPISSSAVTLPTQPVSNNTSKLDTDNDQIRFEHLSLEDGLSHSTVLSIYQDSKGYLWFGTLDGLNKYDGHNFTIYENDPDNPYSLSDNIVQVIFEDWAGNMWFGTVDGGLNRFDRRTERFVSYKHDPADPDSLGSNEVTAVLEDQTGALWVAAFRGGLNKFVPETEQFIRYQHEPDNPGSLSSNQIWAVHADSQGMLWVGTVGGGLNRFNPQTGQVMRYYFNPDDPDSLSHNIVAAIHEDRFGDLWIGTYGGGLNRFDRETGRFSHFQHDYRYTSGIGGNRIISIQEDRAGALWLSIVGKGVDRYDPVDGRFTHFEPDPNDPNDLSGDLILTIFSDQSGVVWLGTSGDGVNKYDSDKRHFIRYQPDPNNKNSLQGSSVSAIIEDSLGILWVGTEAGLNKFNRTTSRYIHYKSDPQDPYSLSSDVVLSILEDSRGILWIGTRNGLNVFDRQAENANVFRHNPLDVNSLIHNSVGVIYEDTAGNIWLGTALGLDKFDLDSSIFVHYVNNPDNPQSITEGGISTIFEDKSGNMWVGTSNGLNKFNQQSNQFVRYQHDSYDSTSLSNDTVLAIFEDDAGYLWVGTKGGGLNKLDQTTGTIQRYLKKDGLANNTIYGILGDEFGNLWLSTNKGLSRFNPLTEIFTNYDKRDGLQSDEFNANAYFQSNSGDLFFGGINGFNVFQPQKITDNPYVPPIVLTTLTQSGKPIAPEQQADTLETVTLRWPNNFFEFEFAALSFSQPEKNQYAYMLEGWEESWNYVGTRPFGRYTNLPGGTYTLRVRGSNNDGVWNDAGVALEVIVVPPFWATWWFRGLTAVLFLSVLVVGYRVRVRTVQNRNRELKRQVSERTHTLAQKTVELDRRRKIAEGLREIMIILNSNRSLADSLRHIVQQAAVLTRADEVIIFRLEANEAPAILANSSGVHLNGELSAYMTLLQDGLTLEDGTRPLRISNFSNGRQPRQYHSLLGIPLKVEDDNFGGLAWFYTDQRTFSEEEVELGFSFADQAALAIANDQLRSTVEETAVEMERGRLARDLHDAVTQTLFSAGLIAEVLPATWDGNRDKGQKLLHELKQLNRGAIAEMRTLLLELRPSALTDANLGDLLKQLADTVTGRTGIPVSVQETGECHLPADVHEALYRIAQEACNNIVKHAQANQVTLMLNCPSAHNCEMIGQRVALQVCDNGRGFNPDAIPPTHLGVKIMRERAESVGAKFKVQSQPEQGTEITVTWLGPTRATNCHPLSTTPHL